LLSQLLILLELPLVPLMALPVLLLAAPVNFQGG